MAAMEMTMCNLRHLRRDAGLTTKELGTIIGVAESTVSQWENGKRNPNYNTLIRLANFFEVTADYLIRGEAELLDSDGKLRERFYADDEKKPVDMKNDNATRKRSALSTQELRDIYHRMHYFQYEGNQVRAVDSDGKRWIVFADICRVLGHKNPNSQIRYVREADKRKLDIGLKNTLANCVSKNGVELYCLLSYGRGGREFYDWAERMIFSA